MAIQDKTGEAICECTPRYLPPSELYLGRLGSCLQDLQTLPADDLSHLVVPLHVLISVSISTRTKTAFQLLLNFGIFL